MTKCRNCGTEFDSKFCPSCGTPAKTVCKECGTEFDSKFCPNCGANAEESEAPKDVTVEKNDSEQTGESVQNELEKQIRSRGAEYAWRKHDKRNYNISGIFILFYVAAVIAAGVVAFPLYYKISDLIDIASAQSIFAFDEYIADIRNFCIIVAVLFAVGIIFLFLSDYFSDVKICKWLKNQDIDAPQIILAGAIKSGKFWDMDEKEFLKTKRYLYDAKCEGVQYEKKYFKRRLIEAVIDIICWVVGIVMLFVWCNTIDVVYSEQLTKYSLGMLLGSIAMMLIVPHIIKRFIRKKFEAHEPDIDAWAEKQKDVSKSAG